MSTEAVKTSLSLARSARLPHLDHFSISKTVRALDEVTSTPELRYARNRLGARVLCMRWSHGAAAHDDLKSSGGRNCEPCVNSRMRTATVFFRRSKLPA
jgi:hypothetical protein